MSTNTAPTSDDIRQSLIDRANAFAARKNRSLGAVSVLCAGDGKFLQDVQAGRNFTVERYQRAMDWFDKNWPAEDAA